MFRRVFWLWTGGTLALFVADRITRTLAFAHAPQTIIPGLLQSAPTTNTGIAFGIGLPGPFTLFLIALLLLVVTAIAWGAYRTGATARWVSALAIICGAASNLLDRLEFGYVRDFLKFDFWPTTANLGDWLITLGTVVLILSFVPKGRTRPEIPQ
ncbi:MAG: signal peptidase II [Patescibacteria group bacterium]